MLTTASSCTRTYRNVADIWDLIPQGSLWKVGAGGAIARPSEGVRGRPTMLHHDDVVLVRRFDRESDNWVEVIVNGMCLRLHPSQFTVYKKEELFRLDT